MTEEALEGVLYNTLVNFGDMDKQDLEECGMDMAVDLIECKVATFEEEGVLTYNRGLVLQFPSGEEFQITIVRSR